MPKDKPVYVLGTSLSHNGSACLLKDGKIVVAIEKERITKVKNAGGNDSMAIVYCLNAAGINFDDLDLIVQNANFGGFAYGNKWYDGRRLLPDSERVVTISHHLAHACSAYYLSPFEEAAVLVVDGCGNAFENCTDLDGATLGECPVGDMASLWFEKDSYYAASCKMVAAKYKDFSPYGRIDCDYPMHPQTTRHSIGGIYAGASKYVFKGSSDLGKLMGLAPYGRPGIYDFDIFNFCDGRIFANYDWMCNFVDRVESEEDFKRRFQYFADIAWKVQKEIECALLKLVHARYELHPSENLCFAGGVALNAVANQRILRESPFKRLFIPPAADDSGLAIGCAYYGWNQVLGRERVPHDGTTFLGRDYDNEEEIRRVIECASLSLKIQRPDNIIGEMANALEEGKTLAWFRGGAEFGPRALGHRSILADPRQSELRDYINSKVKFREDFRPFAPSVLAEDAGQYFEVTTECPYMLLVVPVYTEWRSKLGAVVHVDGTSRIQTVRKDADPIFHSLLSAFKERTGLGMLLNTSFNRRNQPIVETPSDAVKMFLETGLHILSIGPFLVTKSA
ncbi:MAG: transferase [Candidatus Riflebacteria bacterium]|nr:transferase [Candidatus Riflebacteria bacterium]